MPTPLTENEKKLVADSNLLLTKNKIIQSVQLFFGELAEEYKKVTEVESSLHSFTHINAKVSKGENYKGLPYVILDYPRQFGKRDVFAIRTFFWWGHFFSITLQLAGEYQQRYASVIKEAIKNNLFREWYISSSSDPWQHHFENDNYNQLTAFKSKQVLNLPFLKIAKKIPLEKWDEVELFCKENFSFLIKILCT